MAVVPLPRLLYGGLIEAFREEESRWKRSEEIAVKWVASAHDYVYFLGESAVASITTWVVLSASSHISTSGAQLWADIVQWRAKQPSPPLERAPHPPTTGVAQVLPGQLSLGF